MSDIDHKTPKSVDPDQQETQEMEGIYNKATKSLEIQELEASQEAVRDVIWWKRRLEWTGWIMYAVGFFMWVLPDPDNDRAIPVLLIGIAVVLINSFINGSRLRKRRYECQTLLNAILRKNALPLYHQMLEAFSDQPHLHIHLAENGTIIITDKSKKEQK
jgi:hypothetical protein